MRRLVLVAIRLLLLSVLLSKSSANAATMVLPGTGFDANGNALGNYGVDGNWTVSGSQYGSSAYAIMPGDPDYDADWTLLQYGTPNNASNGWSGSSWINNNNQYINGGSVPYTYLMSFNLADFRLDSNLGISGNWGIDDTGTLAINGHAITSASWAWFVNPSAFSVNYSDHPTWFNAGTNTITITMNSTDNYMEGVRFQGIVTGEAVPEPSTFVLFGVGSITFLLNAWRRKRQMA